MAVQAQEIGSFDEKLSDDEKESFIRLTVFEGNFDKNAAKAVIKNSDLDTLEELENLLTKLTSRKLIKQSRNHRFSIHFPILVDDTNNDETRAKARKLMVEYFLELCHNLTQSSYSKDGFKDNRQKLQMEAHNIESVLKICSQQKESNTVIQDCLAESKIYTTSSRFFYNIIRSVITENVIETVLLSCTKLAEERKEHAIKLNFDCLLADHEGRKSNWNSAEYFSRITAIEEEFTNHSKDLEQDKSLCGHYYYHYVRYILNRRCQNKEDLPTKLQKAYNCLTKSLNIRNKLNATALDKTDVIISLLQLGRTCKNMASTYLRNEDRTKCEECNRESEVFFKDAIQLAENNLGKHELTSTCYKALGDLYLTWKENTNALRNHNIAKEMREDLKLDANMEHAFLLNNIGKCLSRENNSREALEVLKKAADIVESEDDVPSTAQGEVYKSLALMYDALGENKEAKRLASIALEINTKMNNKVLRLSDVRKLKTLM